jgi:DNA repair photolyase
MRPPVLNPDGVSVKGCKIIYAPDGQAGEYAPLAANPYRGCGHGCVYCYVPLIPFRCGRRRQSTSRRGHIT